MKFLFLTIFLFSIIFNLSFSDSKEFENKNRCKTFLNSSTKFQSKSHKIQTPYLPFQLQKTIVSKDQKFFIHYDTTFYFDTIKLSDGSKKLKKINNTVDPTDNNGNNIPDYIDSVIYVMEFVYDQYINKWGYPDPTNDHGGSFTPGMDIFIGEIGDTSSKYYLDGGIYGGMTPYNGTSSDSYFLIDNNYSENDVTYDEDTKQYAKSYYRTGINALKVTLAHEFYHTIQLLFAKDVFSSNLNSLFPEMFAVFMEWRFFPEIKDYQQYTKRLLRSENDSLSTTINSLADIEPITGYRLAVFVEMLYKKYGDSFHIKFWQNVSTYISNHNKYLNYMVVLDSTLIGFNSTLNFEWCDFTGNWLYHTGNRAEFLAPDYKLEKYLQDAANLPEMKFDFTNKITDPNEFGRDSSYKFANMMPYTFSGIRTIFIHKGYISYDTLDIIISNKSFEDIIDIGNLKREEYLFSICEHDEDGFNKIANTKINYLIEGKGDWCPTLHLLLGDTTEAIYCSFPNPYKKGDSEIYFPTPDGTEIYQDISLAIFNSDMTPVFSEYLKVEAVTLNSKEGIKTIRCARLNNIPVNLSSGVFVFRVSNQDKSIIGKFTVLK